MSIKANSYQLGVELGLPAGELDVIRKDHAVDQAFNEVILRWLRQQYNVARFGHPTWKRLVEAVQSPIGGNNPALAVEIATSHAPGIYMYPLTSWQHTLHTSHLSDASYY